MIRVHTKQRATDDLSMALPLGNGHLYGHASDVSEENRRTITTKQWKNKTTNVQGSTNHCESNNNNNKNKIKKKKLSSTCERLVVLRVLRRDLDPLLTEDGALVVVVAIVVVVVVKSVAVVAVARTEPAAAIPAASAHAHAWLEREKTKTKNSKNSKNGKKERRNFHQKMKQIKLHKNLHA
jgi:hypothetical protein